MDAYRNAESSLTNHCSCSTARHLTVGSKDVRWPRHPPSDHVELDKPPALDQAVERERGKIESAVAAVHDQFGDAATDRGRLLQPMPAEPVGKEHVAQGLM